MYLPLNIILYFNLNFLYYHLDYYYLNFLYCFSIILVCTNIIIINQRSRLAIFSLFQDLVSIKSVSAVVHQVWPVRRPMCGAWAASRQFFRSTNCIHWPSLGPKDSVPTKPPLGIKSFSIPEPHLSPSNLHAKSHGRLTNNQPTLVRVSFDSTKRIFPAFQIWYIVSSIDFTPHPSSSSLPTSTHLLHPPPLMIFFRNERAESVEGDFLLMKCHWQHIHPSNHFKNFFWFNLTFFSKLSHKKSSI